MKRILPALVIGCLSISLNGQVLNIRTVTPSEGNYRQHYNNNHPFLDTRDLKQNINFYDGQQIMILPVSGRNYEYIAGFKSPSGKVYKGEESAGKFVLHYDKRTYPNTDGYTSPDSGIYTPKSELEGHTFGVNSIKFSSRQVTRQFDGWSDFVYTRDITMELTDENGSPVIFSCEWYNDGNMPFLMPSFLEAYNKFLGNEYYLKGTEKNKSLARATSDGTFRLFTEPVTFTEIGYVEDSDGLLPYIFFVDKEGIEYYLPLYRISPSSYDMSQDEHLHWFLENKSITSLYNFISTEELKEETQKAEQERIAAVNLANAAERKRQAAERQTSVNAAMMAVQRGIYLIQKYGDKDGSMIAAGKVKIGMTKEQCTDAWGKPSDINTTVVSNLVSEQWVYVRSGKKTAYLYFENGRLTAIQK